jgi:hypothetical protein
MAVTETTLGTRRVKPSDCFIATDQTISSRPAIKRTIQAMRPSFTFESRAVPDEGTRGRAEDVASFQVKKYARIRRTQAAHVPRPARVAAMGRTG